jgi:hypothetical protein
LTGIITEFLYAYLTRRAFQILSYGDIPGLEIPFDSPHINWTADFYPSNVYEHMKKTFEGDRGTPPDLDKSLKYAYMFQYNSEPTDFYMKSNFSVDPRGIDDATHVFIALNRGRSFRMLENPHYREHFRKMGLRPELAFYCVFNYLFQPSQKVLDLMKPTMDAILKPDILTIGISIRTGDHVFSQVDNAVLSNYEHFFDCAEQIQSSRRVLGQTVLWYLISDSMKLKRQAKKNMEEN